MSYYETLKNELRELAVKYALNKELEDMIHPSGLRKTAVLFSKPEYSFHPDSWNEIKSKKKYNDRIKKTHSNVGTGILEMQSSNSSDALAMNIFCYPKIKEWKGIANLFGLESITDIEFGIKPNIHKTETKEEKTEIDLVLHNADEKVYCECKLTESDFTSKEKEEVLKYKEFHNIFEASYLPQTDKEFNNYQLIRNILAAEQKKTKFVLICDMRRPDLAREFYRTVRCIKDSYIELRNSCEIIYWQDIANVSGQELKEFLFEKYGM